MIPAEILRKKRDGAELSSDEINAFINGLIQGNVTLT
jgi:thymidine phosphorylase